MRTATITVTNAAGTDTIKADGSKVHFKAGEGCCQTEVAVDDLYVTVVADGRRFVKADVSLG